MLQDASFEYVALARLFGARPHVYPWLGIRREGTSLALPHTWPWALKPHHALHIAHACIYNDNFSML